MLHKIRFNKKIWLCIFLLEVILLGVSWIALRHRPYIELSYTQDDLVYNNGEAGFYLDSSYNARYVTTPEITLPRGFYTLEAECEYQGSTRIEVVYSDERVNANVSDTINPSNHARVACDFRVTYTDRPLQVRGRLGGDSGEGDYILVRNIRIVSSPLTVKNTLFRITLFLVFIDLLLFGICHREYIKISEERAFDIKILILLVVIVSIPLMVNYLFVEAHDLRFHLARIEGIKNELLNGSFPVKMQSSWLYGHGYPVSIFYGDVFLYIPAILRIFGVPLWASYNFYVLLINTGTVFLGYYCFSKMGTARTGLVCTIIYSLNIYRLYDVYTRMAVGEYTALMFLPLVLYGMWRIYTLPEESEEHGRSWIPLSTGCLGIFFSHMLSTEITAFFIILAAILLWKRTFRKRTFYVLLKAGVSTLLLGIWFLVPFFDYLTSGTYIINDPSAYVRYRLEGRGAFPAQLVMNVFSAMHDASATQTSVGAAHDMPLNVGLASMFALAGWFVFCCGKKRDVAEKKEEYLAVFLSVLSLGMTLYCFPWTWLVDKLPILQMVVRSIQFAWRFFAIAGLMLVWLLNIILQKEWIAKKQRQIFAGLLVFIAFWQGISYVSGVLDEASLVNAFQTVHMDIEGAEYLLVDWGTGYKITDYTKDYVDQLTYEEGIISVEDWHRDKGAVVVSLTNNGNETMQVEVPLINYKGYHAIADSGDELAILPGTSYRISVSVPAGFDGSFRVAFKEPWYWRISEIISLSALLGIIIYQVYAKKKSRSESYMVMRHGKSDC